MFEETSLKPIFMQIAEWVEDEIMNGHIKEGDQIPSTNQFAIQFQINPATAGKGMNLLVEEEIIYKKRGIGMFVKEGAYGLIQAKRKERFQSHYVKVLLEEARKIGFQKQDVIDMIDQISEG